MTNKPMLSVERELIESVSAMWPEGAEFDESGRPCWLPHVMQLIKDLRALLDEPAKPIPECVGDLERFEADDGVFVRLGDVIDMLGNEKAAPHQGEPVAWIVTDMNGDSYFAYDRQTPSDKPLYAEQPAQVAVAMPEHTMRSVMDAIQQARGFPVLTSNQCHALAESLNYVARLNGVKP